MEHKRPRHDVTAQHMEDKSSMLAAALELRNTLHEDTAHTSDVQLALSIQAARAHQSNNLTSLSQAIRAYPKLLNLLMAHTSTSHSNCTNTSNNLPTPPETRSSRSWRNRNLNDNTTPTTPPRGTYTTNNTSNIYRT